MKMKLPERIAYACMMPTQSEDLYGNQITIVPTVPYDPSDERARKVALDCARRGWGEGGSTMDAPTFEIRNEPFSLRLLSIDRRAKGGRVYKVIDDKGRVFDLKEDMLLQAMRVDDIEKGGQFKSTFVWGKARLLKLLVVGGTSHESIVNAPAIARRKRQLLKEQAPLSGSDLEVGGLYQGAVKGMDKFVYIGRVTCPATKKLRYAVIRFNKWTEEQCKNIVLLSSVRAITRLGTVDVSSQRKNENLEIRYSAGNEYHYYDTLLELPKVRRLTQICASLTAQGTNLNNSWRNYTLDVRGKASVIYEQELRARLAAYRDGLVWHD